MVTTLQVPVPVVKRIAALKKEREAARLAAEELEQSKKAEELLEAITLVRNMLGEISAYVNVTIESINFGQARFKMTIEGLPPIDGCSDIGQGKILWLASGDWSTNCSTITSLEADARRMLDEALLEAGNLLDWNKEGMV